MKAPRESRTAGPDEAPGNPFIEDDDSSENRSDTRLALLARDGDAAALESLVQKHHDWIYNLSLRFMLNPVDAGDLAQEALIKIVTRIGGFEGRSAFRTWAYRIVANTFLDARRGRLENAITNFTDYGRELDQVPLQNLSVAGASEPERHVLIEEAKLGCMLGMLLCLDREQRLTYLIGEIMEAPSQVGGEILGITAAAFRKRLERARRDLSAFMNDKCGLINTNNPCRCEKKTAGFIKAGWVDPANIKFTGSHLQKLRRQSGAKAAGFDRLYQNDYAPLFREHPFYRRPDLVERIQATLAAPETERVFRLGPEENR
ncbi:MAG: RNA polymerase sigma factor [bacterium]|nr:RNA polymerase sigma factor [bacterium]